MRQIFAKAAEQGVAMSRVIAFESRQPEARVYPNRMWESPFIGNSSSFDPQGYFNLEARTTFHFTADGITPGHGDADARRQGLPLPDDLQRRRRRATSTAARPTS
jgi:hypothetical protein